jgi:metal-responsive CopG/Arc/MetJ family transcriptional regulator
LKATSKTIDLIAISWFEFVDFLQEHFNFKHLKLFKINAKLKKIRQLNEQSIIYLIVYLNNLKMQMSKELSNYQKYFNLMKILNFFLKVAIIKSINAIIFKAELKKIVRLTKKIESISNHIKKIKKSYSIENIKQHRFQFYNRIDRIDADASQNAIQNNDRDDDRDRKNYKKRDKKNRDDKFDNDTNRF